MAKLGAGRRAPIRKSPPLAALFDLMRPIFHNAGVGGFELPDGELESDDGNRMFSPIREKQPNRFPLKRLSNSKRSSFENRIEWAEYRGSERNGRFGE